MNGSIRRIEPTLLVLAVLVAGPFFGAALQHGTPPHEWAIGYGITSALHVSVDEYLHAAWICVLLSSWIPALRLRREGTARQRTMFDQAIPLLGLGLALPRIIIHAQAENSPSFVPQGAPVSVGECVVWALVITAALFAIMAWITRDGIGNGVALVVLATGYVAPFVQGTRTEIERLQHTSLGLFRAPYAVAGAVGLVVLCRWYLAARQDLHLTTAASVPSHATVPVTLPIRWNLVGATPAFFAWAVIASVDVAFDLAGHPSPLHGAPYWIAFALLLVIGSYAFTAITFDTAWVGTLLQRHGLDLADRPADVSVESYLDRLIERRIAVSAAVLVAVILAPFLLGLGLGIQITTAGWTGQGFLIACAVIADTVRNVRAHRAIEAAEAAELDQAEAEAGDGAAAEVEIERWVEVASYDVELEAALVRARLEQQGIGAIIVSNRAVSLLGTFAPWEWTVPAYPGLAIHRRLGGGRVSLRVPAAAAARAAAVLDTIPAAPALVSAPA